MAATETVPKAVAIPMKLDAFIFNEAVCGGSGTLPDEDENKDHAKIAPISQPNYTFLRFEPSMVQNDILNFTDLHKTGPAAFNRRFTNLGTGEAFPKRQGVYIHWIVPKPYRSGSTMSQDQKTKNQHAQRKGFRSTTASAEDEGDHGPDDDDDDDDPPPPPDSIGSDAPSFNPAPSRWLVIRKVEECDPPEALPAIDAWVVESDRRQVLDDIPTRGVDLQVDFAPYLFLPGSGSPEDLTGDELRKQAEVFIGHKEGAVGWREKADTPEDAKRVDLNLLNSSNQLFPDYQPHNSNVFSIIDNLQDSQGQTVSGAKLNYYVLGWHSRAGDDLFGNLSPNGLVSRGDRLNALSMALDESGSGDTAAGIKEWLASKDPTRVVCHGSMYGVVWTSDKKPENVPADVFYDKVHLDMAVAVGTTPLDAVLSYVKSQNPGNGNGDGAGGGGDNSDIPDIERDLVLLEKFLHARDDGVDAMDEAEDAVYNWNYARSPGGSRYFLGGSEDPSNPSTTERPTRPEQRYIEAVDRINQQQNFIDAIDRQSLLLQWQLFAFWWKYMSDLTRAAPDPTRIAVDGMRNKLQELARLKKFADDLIKVDLGLIPEGLAKPGVLPPFSAARDPTMLVAGIESGWPYDYLDNLRVRLDTQLFLAPGGTATATTTTTSGADSSPLQQFVSGLNLPDLVKETAVMLAGEFEALYPVASAAVPAAPAAAAPATAPATAATTSDPQPGYVIPLYHDVDKAHALPNGKYPWRDRWENSQAWFPLFMEWVGEYTHIPCDEDNNYWTLDHRTAWKSTQSKLCYGINKDTDLAELHIEDRRTVSGRVLILPTPNFNLQAVVFQVLDYLPDGVLDKDEAERLRDHLHELAFLSSPLSGFTDHLLTRVEGNHIKPTLRVTDRESGKDTVAPFAAAVDVGRSSGFDAPALSAMGIQTDLTPYASLVPYIDKHHTPFKPVTHGQFRLTGLNIIDKFGQAIPAIYPEPLPDDEGPPPLYPCMSEYYVPQPAPDDPASANTVVRDLPGRNQYTQIPPTINQPARLNLGFVDFFPGSNTDGSWRPLTDWDAVENYVWGWVVANYADDGIQLFLPDGTFFREVRRGGPKGAAQSAEWLPFKPPKRGGDPEPGNEHQLALLADALGDADYLNSFMSMLTVSLGTTAAAPSAYSEFLSSLVGRPLALVKTAYSLELATEPLQNTSTVNTPNGTPVPPELALTDYTFRMQLGHPSRVYDGLIAYFKPKAKPVAGDTLDLSTLYTHFVPEPSRAGARGTPNLARIDASNYPSMHPFWINPSKQGDPGPRAAAAYAAAWNSEQLPLGALVDPFTPVHAFSGVLPVTTVQLPAWTWQQALSKMTAFFHMGPLLTPADVPRYDRDHELATAYDLANNAQLAPGQGIGVPTLQSGQWAWLQPYSVVPPGPQVRELRDDEDENGNEEEETHFMALSMAAVDDRPRFEESPYTAVEGYMQLRTPIVQQNPA